LKINGHAIELRLCAEDPANNFLPDTGRLETYIRPQGPGVRVDDGYEAGMDIPIFYDPMISKLIAWGADREEARLRLIRAIDEYRVTGIKTTLPFGRWALQQTPFIDGNFDTNFIGRYFTPQALDASPDDEAARAAAILAAVLWEQPAAAPLQVNGSGKAPSRWKQRRKAR